jgi:hypothetical protein
MNLKRNVFALMLCSTVAFTFFSCKKEMESEVTPASQEESQVAGRDEVCGAVMFTDAGARERMKEMESRVQERIAEMSSFQNRTEAFLNIPVVFHVVYNTSEQNISDAQLISQVAVLNEDFSATNIDYNTVPAAFQPLRGNAQIRFVMAARDPNGNATNGITRTYTSVTSFGSDGAVCYNSSGGRNAWPSNQYLNIWVCKKSGSAGYSSYPWSGVPATDGIIVGYNYVGRTGTFTNNWNYQKGRTVTHEVGHWLGLIHIWGDASCGDDLVGDTPTQSAASGSCPVFPRMSSCSPNSNGDMFMNYMDYTYDACRTMFSISQVTRMRAYLAGTRASITTSLGGTPPSTGTCNVPGGLVAASITSNSALLSWVSTGAVSYYVRYKPTSSSTWTISSLTGLSLNVASLASSTAYEFQVQSVCTSGSSTYSASTGFTTLAAATCNVPSGLYSSSVTSGSATLNWSSTGAVSYNVRYKPTSSSTWITTTATTPSKAVTGLSASTMYEFQVQSVCLSGSSSYSASTTFMTSAATACNIPSGLNATSITYYGATLTWSSTGAVSYNIRYKATSSSTWSTINSYSLSSSIAGLSANTYYEFQVQSVCSSSSSAFSSSFVFKTTKRNGHS